MRHGAYIMVQVHGPTLADCQYESLGRTLAFPAKRAMLPAIRASWRAMRANGKPTRVGFVTVERGPRWSRRHATAAAGVYA